MRPSMWDDKKRRISFPHFGSYGVPIAYLFNRGLDVHYITPPPMTKRTLELGSRHSPDNACAPFKIHLGCYLEAIEQGADTLIQVSGACRLGYFGELHEQIIKDLGYDVDFINVARFNMTKKRRIYGQVKEYFPELSLQRFTPALLTTFAMVESIDELEDFLRRHIGFEKEQGAFEQVFENYLASLPLVENRKELKYLHSNCLKRMKAIPVELPKKPLRVGIVGEYYSVMDPFSNHHIERELARKGIMVERWMNVSNTVLHNPAEKLLDSIKGYAKYNIGATGMYTIERALKFARKGYDGIIHVKSFGCTPETDAMPVLQNISADYKIPILYFSFDTQTGEEGIHTRLEAFHDMMLMRKEAQ